MKKLIFSFEKLNIILFLFLKFNLQFNRFSVLNSLLRFIKYQSRAWVGLASQILLQEIYFLHLPSLSLSLSLSLFLHCISDLGLTVQIVDLSWIGIWVRLKNRNFLLRGARDWQFISKRLSLWIWVMN